MTHGTEASVAEGAFWLKGRRCVSQDGMNEYASSRPGEIYIVQTRHCLEMGMPVYKIGRSDDVLRRLHQHYPRGSIIVARALVPNMRNAEIVLLGLCQVAFVRRRDFGHKYFEADLQNVLALLDRVEEMFAVEERGT